MKKKHERSDDGKPRSKFNYVTLSRYYQGD